MRRATRTQGCLLAAAFLAAILISAGSPSETYSWCGLLADGWDEGDKHFFAVASDSFHTIRMAYYRSGYDCDPGTCPSCSWSTTLGIPQSGTLIGLTASESDVGPFVTLFYADGRVYMAQGIDDYCAPLCTGLTCQPPSGWSLVYDFGLACGGVTAVPDHDPDAVPAPTRLLCTPNPTRRAVNVHFVVTQAGPIDVCVYDASGRLVNTLYETPTAFGSYSLEWNGEDNTSNPVPSGVYFIQVRDGIDSVTSRVVLIQ